MLLVRGALSDLLAPDSVTEMRQRHKGSFMHVDVPGRGHAPMLDEQVALAAIEDFLGEYLK